MIPQEDEPWDDDFGKEGVMATKKSGKIQPRCYESHPPYEVALGFMIYGGSCGWPIIKDADIYGGFDMSMHKASGGYPWSEQTGPVEFLFKITDMQAPSNPAEFKRMIEWLAEQLEAGKKIHVGCIGGHGRTGTVLAALRKHMTGDEDATQHVRDNYCKKAVESSSQIKFLQEHWGINPVQATKSYSYGSSSSQKSFGLTEYEPGSFKGFDLREKQKYHSFDDKPKHSSTGQPLHSEHSIWG